MAMSSCRRVLPGASCDGCAGLFFLMNAVWVRNTPGGSSLAHLVDVGLGFPYI